MLRHGFLSNGLRLIAGLGHGIAPDVEVEDLPKDAAAGRDPQLERAVSIVLEQLKEHPVVEPVIPPYPNYHEHDELGRR